MQTLPTIIHAYAGMLEIVPGGENMTQTGQLVLSLYSLLSVVILITINIKRVTKEGDGEWELILLIPVLIYLSNII